MVNTYLSWRYHFPFLVASLFLFKLSGSVGAGIIALFYLMLAWLFRDESLKDHYDLSQEDLVAPFSGKIKTIFPTTHVLVPENYQCIEFHYNFFQGYGIYFPKTMEVYDIVKNDYEIFINLITDKNENMIVHFKSNIGGLLPNLRVYPGDRGKSGACMGYFPYGGKLFFYISNKYMLNPSNQQVFLGGKSLVATLAKES